LKRSYYLVLMLALSPSLSWGSLVNFHATGNPDVSGYVQFDDSSFDGSTSQFLLNSSITDLSLTAFGSVFTLADVVTADTTIINSADAIPIIVNGAGLLANNGSQAIAFFPEGFDGTAINGDASLAYSTTPTFGPFTYHAVKWEASVVPIPAAVWLFGSGLLGLIGIARRKKVT